MADHEEPSARGLFGGVFARGGADTSDVAWLQAMLDAEAGLARAAPGRALLPFSRISTALDDRTSLDLTAIRRDRGFRERTWPGSALKLLSSNL